MAAASAAPRAALSECRKADSRGANSAERMIPTKAGKKAKISAVQWAVPMVDNSAAYWEHHWAGQRAD